VVRGVGTPVVGGELCTVPGRHGTGRSTSTVRSARDRAAQEKSTTPSGSTRAARTVTSVSGRKPSPVRWKTVDSPAPVAVIRIAGRSAPRGGGGGGGDAGGTRIVISTNVPFRVCHIVPSCPTTQTVPWWMATSCSGSVPARDREP